jgi:hypothetical protein
MDGDLLADAGLRASTFSLSVVRGNDGFELFMQLFGRLRL